MTRYILIKFWQFISLKIRHGEIKNFVHNCNAYVIMSGTNVASVGGAIESTRKHILCSFSAWKDKTEFDISSEVSTANVLSNNLFLKRCFDPISAYLATIPIRKLNIWIWESFKMLAKYFFYISGFDAITMRNCSLINPFLLIVSFSCKINSLCSECFTNRILCFSKTSLTYVIKQLIV